MSEGWRGRLYEVAQYLLGGVALWWLLRQGDWGDLWASLARLTPWLVASLVAVTLVGLVFRVLMWHVLVVHAGRRSFRAAVEIDLVVNFLNQLLPSRLSGRSAAPLVIHDRTGLGFPTAVALTGVSTGLYGVLYGVTSFAGLGLTAGSLPVGIVLLLALSSALYVAAGVTVLLAGLRMDVVDRIASWFGARAGWIPVVGGRLESVTDAVPEFTGPSRDAFAAAIGSPRVVGGFAVAWIGAVAVFPAVRVWLLFEGLGAGFEPLLALPVVLIAAYSVTLLPLTPGGIGVTEATATVVFVALGVPYEVAASAILVDRILGVYLPALAGWVPAVRVDLSSLSPD